VRFTPNSDRKSRHPQMVMSALPPKADMCGARDNVCFGPIADMASGRDGFRPSALPTGAILSRVGRIDRRLAPEDFNQWPLHARTSPANKIGTATNFYHPTTQSADRDDVR